MIDLDGPVARLHNRRHSQGRDKQIATIRLGSAGAVICVCALALLVPSVSASQHWAFQPVSDRPVPRVHNHRWPKTELDYFILAKLEQQGLSPSPPADKYTLLRRATFDLIGLPATPEEINDFIDDRSPEAMARVIDRLMGRPQYGERWGRHWLDLARYSDTAGDSADYPIPQAYKYRDYVIRAFNSDTPYDEFLRQQIAGDLLIAGSEEQRRDGIIGTGFLALARRFGVDPAVTAHLTIEDTLDTIGRSVLGLSFSCARCHDHKYDPVSMRDYYSLYGIFGSTRFPYAGSEVEKKQKDLVPLLSEAEMERIYGPTRRQWEAMDAEVKRLQKELELLNKEGLDVTEISAALKNAKAKRRAITESTPPLDTAFAVGEGNPTNAPIQVRGEPSKPGDIIRRGQLDLLGKALRPALTNEIAPAESVSGRVEFANWLTDPKNPLTARVMVNRIWQHHFGQGLVATSGDFGTRGQEPSHPELLDFLALQFIKSGWSIKAMHRMIMLSSAYQQSSFASSAQSDSDNRWLCHMNRQRLDAESVRDAMLATSGTLDVTMAGEHPFPSEDGWDYTQHTPFTAVYPTSRRSVYIMQQRIRKHPFFAVFDGADPNVSTTRRTPSITPLQALFLMNDKFTQEQAESFAGRICRERSALRERIRYAYQLAFGRPPSADELRKAERYLAGDVAASGNAVWTSFARALLASNEFIFLD